MAISYTIVPSHPHPHGAAPGFCKCEFDGRPITKGIHQRCHALGLLGPLDSIPKEVPACHTGLCDAEGHDKLPIQFHAIEFSKERLSQDQSSREMCIGSRVIIRPRSDSRSAAVIGLCPRPSIHDKNGIISMCWPTRYVRTFLCHVSGALSRYMCLSILASLESSPKLVRRGVPRGHVEWSPGCPWH